MQTTEGSWKDIITTFRYLNQEEEESEQFFKICNEQHPEQTKLNMKFDHYKRCKQALL